MTFYLLAFRSVQRITKWLYVTRNSCIRGKLRLVNLYILLRVISTRFGHYALKLCVVEEMYVKHLEFVIVSRKRINLPC